MSKPLLIVGCFLAPGLADHFPASASSRRATSTGITALWRRRGRVRRDFPWFSNSISRSELIDRNLDEKPMRNACNISDSDDKTQRGGPLLRILRADHRGQRG